MSESYPFSTYSGILDPTHYQNIGSSLWLFLWAVSSTTDEIERKGIVWGVVLGNKPMKLGELSIVFGVSDKTIRRWLDVLEKHEYIKVTRAPYGLILTVKNSKRGFIQKKKRLDKNVQSENRDKTKVSPLNKREDRNDHSGMDKSVQSNKDISNVVVVDNKPQKSESQSNADYLLDYYMVVRGKPGMPPKVSDYQHVQAVLKAGVSIEEAVQGIDQAFRDFTAAYHGDEINSFAYCKKVILAHHYRLQQSEEASNVRPFRKPEQQDEQRYDYGF